VVVVVGVVVFAVIIVVVVVLRWSTDMTVGWVAVDVKRIEL
jgi:hypothetical protein